MDDWESIFDNLPLQPTLNSESNDEGYGHRVLGDLEHAYSTASPCANCTGNRWDVDVERGDLICLICGACFSAVVVNQPLRSDQRKAFEQGRAVPCEDARNVTLAVPEGASLGGKRRRRLQTSIYRRAVYFKNRLRAWLRSDPPIPGDDWDYIEAGFSNFCAEIGIKEKIPTGRELRLGRGRRIEHCYSPSYREVRRILSLGDAVRNEDNKFDEDWVRGRGLLSKYGKRWMQIRYRLSGDTGNSAHVPDVLVELLLNDLARSEEAFDAVERPFRRKAFPFLNETVARLFEFYSMEDLAIDFPGLRTRRAQKKFYLLWWRMCKYWKWPFLCKDAQILKAVTKLK